MSFYNPCCRALTAATTNASTGDELTCASCGNRLMFDGLRFVNTLELGPRKIRKLLLVRRANHLATGTSSAHGHPSAQPTPTTAN